MINKVAFSGLLKAGKDWVAQQAGFPIYGFADPMYLLSEHYIGTGDKSVPGVRRFLQDIGAWGRNYISEQHPLTVERMRIIREIRQYVGRLACPQYPMIDWRDFGYDETFWIKTLQVRIHGLKGRAAVVNYRFDNERQMLSDEGFESYLVLCSEQTRKERIEQSGEIYDSSTLDNITEKYSQRLKDELPHDRIIWNDHREAPKRTKYLTVEQFVAKVNSN